MCCAIHGGRLCSSVFAFRRPILLAAAAVLGTAGPLLAADKTYVGPASGDWNTSSYWSPAGVPAAGDDVTFAPSGSNSYSFDGNYSSASPLGALTIGNGDGSSPTLVQSENTLSTDADSLISGGVDQAAGTLDAGSVTVGTGEYGAGSFELAGGTASITNFLNVGDNTGVLTGGAGSFQLGSSVVVIHTVFTTAGTLSAGSVTVGNGAAGSFTEIAGVANISGLLSVGQEVTNTLGNVQLTRAGTGTYAMGGGTLNAETISIANDGASTFNLSGGNVTTPAINIGNGGNGTFLQSGGTVSLGSQQVAANVNVGMNGGTGSLIQSGGYFSINLGGMAIGSGTGSTGTVNVSGGTMIIDELAQFGFYGAGTLLQSGGYINGSWVIIGGTAGTGTANLSGGTLNIPGGNLDVAFSGPGTFTQSGTSYIYLGLGTNGFPASMQIGSDYGNGVATLTGGTISAEGGAIALSAGTLSQSGTSYIDLTDGGLAISGMASFSGGTISAEDATLIEVDAGTMLQSGTSYMDFTDALMIVSYGNPALASFSSGTLLVPGAAVYVGAYGFNPNGIDVYGPGSGTFLQSGTSSINFTSGSMYVGVGTSATGTAEFSAGTLNASMAGIYVGVDGYITLPTSSISSDARGVEPDFIVPSAGPGIGTFLQNGTSYINLASGSLSVGYGTGAVGTADFSAGTLNAPGGAFYVGVGSGAGTLQQSGTSSLNLASGTMIIGDGGTGYASFSGGTFSAPGAVVYVGGSGGVGTLQIGGTSNFNLGSGGLVVGDGGAGTFVQSASAGTMGGFIVGDLSSGYAALSGGTLTATFTTIGLGSASGGTFVQSGSLTVANLGTLTVGSLGQGTLLLTAGTLDAGPTFIGLAGAGTLSQSGSATFSKLGAMQIGSTGTLALSGGTMQVQTTKSAGSILVSGGTLAITGAGSLGTGSITSISITGNGVFDVGKSGFVLPYTGISPIGELNRSKHTQSYPATSIQRYLQTAIDGGNWDGPGISSTAAFNDFTGVTAVGALDNNDLLALQGNNYTGETWMGQPITSNNTVLVRFTYYGDTNLDGVVNGIDVDNLIQGFEGFGDGWLYGDFNYDGIVDSLDVTEMIIGYSGQGKPLGDAISPGQAQFLLSLSSGLSAAQISRFEQVVGVPEPGALGLLGVAVGGLARRRRRLLVL